MSLRSRISSAFTQSRKSLLISPMQMMSPSSPADIAEVRAFGSTLEDTIFSVTLKRSFSSLANQPVCSPAKFASWENMVRVIGSRYSSAAAGMAAMENSSMSERTRDRIFFMVFFLLFLLIANPYRYGAKPFLSFHGADHNAFDEVPLEEGVYAQDRQRNHHRHSHPHGQRRLFRRHVGQSAGILGAPDQRSKG